MAGGGKRRGAGRPREVSNFRAFCRTVVSRPEVQEKISQHALENPEFALRVAEHGYGRPPQALDVRHGSLGDDPLEFVVTFHDGDALPSPSDPTATGTLPVSAEVVE